MFDNARIGIKRMFVGQIALTISSIIYVVSSMIALIVLFSDTNNEIASLIPVVISFIIMAIAAVVYFLGVIKAAKDEPYFSTALLLLIGWFILDALYYISLGPFEMTPFLSTLAKICDIVANMMQLFSFIFVIKGVAVIAEEFENQKLIDFGSKIRILIYTMYILSMIGELLDVLFNDKLGETIAQIDLTIVGLFKIVLFVFYMIFLGKATKMWKNES